MNKPRTVSTPARLIDTNAYFLFDPDILAFNPTLATAIGLKEALFVQRIHFWPDRPKVARDGHMWLCAVPKVLQEEFPFWSLPTIKRIVGRLESWGLIVTCKFSDQRHDNRKLYRVNYNHPLFTGGEK